MPTFKQKKQNFLNKKDKSSKGNWDKKILNLCNKINENENYFTTSSCSGRIVLIKNNLKKQPNLFQFVSHEKINKETLIKELKKIINKKNNLIYFKQEPVILHVACKTLESTEQLLKKSQQSGFKKSGIISLSKNITLEINSTEKIELPIIFKNKILINNNYLKILIKEANKKLEKNWSKIKTLEKLI